MVNVCLHWHTLRHVGRRTTCLLSFQERLSIRTSEMPRGKRISDSLVRTSRCSSCCVTSMHGLCRRFQTSLKQVLVIQKEQQSAWDNIFLRFIGMVICHLKPTDCSEPSCAGLQAHCAQKYWSSSDSHSTALVTRRWLCLA